MKPTKKAVDFPKEVLAGIENYRRKQEIIPSFSKAVIDLLKAVLEISNTQEE